ncbi:MAG: hypothetical protein COV44_07535 [Deltaproteobacteria bacterium CG11_big_fil_rev_8_21_14_0_20_45_16]|nr:MAG: hypothetical protein COV44_07535 [Deltaproteobacteria bacterium CG11_big_fil_rev_8_21_14_0_20_45_16]
MTQITNIKNTESQDSHVSNSPGDRDTFIGEIREKLNKIQTKMTSMRDDSSRLAGDLKKKADENLVKLDAKYKTIKSNLDELKNSTQANWKTDREEFQKSFEELSINFKGLFS